MQNENIIPPPRRVELIARIHCPEIGRTHIIATTIMVDVTQSPPHNEEIIRRWCLRWCEACV